MNGFRLIFVIFVTIIVVSCGGSGSGGGDSSSPSPPSPPSHPSPPRLPRELVTINSINSFKFLASSNPLQLSHDVVASIGTNTITIKLPFGTDVRGLVASFAASGESVTVNGINQISGTTPNNFSNPLIYWVIASDGTTKDYTIIISFLDGEVGDSITYTAGDVLFKMIYVPNGITYPTGQADDGLSSSGTNDFLIGETEVTYELWYAVRDWAEYVAYPPYYFANKGKEGHDGIEGDDPTFAKQEPVGTLNWRDTMVWMNALTEYYNEKNNTNLTPVYTYLGSIIRDSRDSNDATCDSVVANSDSNGFRLLSSDEWGFAARYIKDKNNDGDILDAGEYYPGGYSSGADTYRSITSGATDYDGDGDVEYTIDVAVFRGAWKTADVKSKSPNSLGIYDMNGNVWEWLFDLNGTNRVDRGGGYFNDSSYQTVSFKTAGPPSYEGSSMGTRIGRTQ